MKTVTLDTFYKFEDFELSQYQILSCIKKFQSDLRQYKLFPGLEELTELIFQFENINTEEIASGKKDNYENKSDNIWESSDDNSTDSEYLDKVFSLIEWARPLIQELVDEGNIIYDYIESTIDISKVSNSKSRKDLGFLLIPDNKRKAINLLQYYVTKTDKPFSKKIIKTKLINSFSNGMNTQLSSNMLRVIKNENIDLDDTCVFICNTDLDFPFSETLLPVVQTKLLGILLE